MRFSVIVKRALDLCITPNIWESSSLLRLPRVLDLAVKNSVTILGDGRRIMQPVAMTEDRCPPYVVVDTVGVALSLKERRPVCSAILSVVFFSKTIVYLKVFLL